MNAMQERKAIRWLHILAGIPLAGYLYGPVADIPPASIAVKAVIFPALVLSGFWLWKGAWLKAKLRKIRWSSPPHSP